MSESVKHQAEPQLRVYRRRKGEAKGFTWSDYRDLIYANADITKAEQAAEIIAFADYRQLATGSDPGLLVFDSQLTTYKILDQLTGRGIGWLTLPSG